MLFIYNKSKGITDSNHRKQYIPQTYRPYKFPISKGENLQVTKYSTYDERKKNQGNLRNKNSREKQEKWGEKWEEESFEDGKWGRTQTG